MAYHRGEGFIRTGDPRWETALQGWLERVARIVRCRMRGASSEGARGKPRRRSANRRHGAAAPNFEQIRLDRTLADRRRARTGGQHVCVPG